MTEQSLYKLAVQTGSLIVNTVILEERVETLQKEVQELNAIIEKQKQELDSYQVTPTIVEEKD